MRISRIGERLSGWPRRTAAIGCLVLAALSAFGTSRASHDDGPTTGVLVSARALATGTVLAANDLRFVQWPIRLRPATALSAESAALGQRLAAPLADGDVLTSERLLGGNLTVGLPRGLIAAPVTLSNAASATLIRAGNYVDLLSPAAPDATESAAAQILALGVLVLAVVPAQAGATTASALLIVAVDRATELQIAQTSGSSVLATVTVPP